MVVAVIGIVSAVVLPKLRTPDRSKARGAAQMLAADLAFAQAATLTDAEDPCVVVFDLDAESYHLARASDPATPITDPIRKQPYVTAYGSGRAAHLEGVTLVSASVGGDGQLAFQPYGNLDQATPAVVVVESGGLTMSVSVDPDTGESTLAG